MRHHGPPARATVNTWNGLVAAARSEAAFRQELAALVLAAPLAFLIAGEAWKRLALIGGGRASSSWSSC